jgi:hypothetical protein
MSFDASQATRGVHRTPTAVFCTYASPPRGHLRNFAGIWGLVGQGGARDHPAPFALRSHLEHPEVLSRALHATGAPGQGTLGPRTLAFLEACVRGRANVIVSGGTSSGKTTLLGVLSTCVPDEERLVTIEDAAELRLAKPHVVSLEARPPNVEGKGEVTVRELVRNALRMRPDRIIVGEVRGGEAIDMLQAMNTGHDGSLSTAHANSPRPPGYRPLLPKRRRASPRPTQPVLHMIERIVAPLGLRVDESAPWMDARLPDGSRMHTRSTRT